MTMQQPQQAIEVQKHLLCTDAACDEEARYTYVWPWGEQGACCATHAVLVQQKAKALGRGPVQLVPIDPGRPMPVSRDERARLKADVIVRDEDITALKRQIAELHTDGAKLSDEARRLRARNRHLEELQAEMGIAAERAQKERDESLAMVGELRSEVERLTVLVDPELRTRPQP